jgi:glycosyltransferase involved in cell wall biosynthesis
MCRRSEALVSVIIPAFNAATTIRETLRSVCAQTHRRLEIIVVDDGSTDATVDIVTKLASDDPRIFLIEQRNGGVAAARNSGAAAASGTFLAPVDADDLWHPLKIEKQLDAFAAAGQGCGLVYTWSALIDGSGRVTHRRRGSLACGDVLYVLSRRNFVGNGSSALIPTSVFRQTHGYDPSLHARGGQGCEDWKLYLEIAAQWHFTVVPEHLTGYRVVPGNMSSNALRMLRSRDLVSADLLPHHPELASALRRGRNRLSRFLLNRALSERRWRDAAGILGSMARFDGLHLTVALASVAAGAFRRTAERAGSSREAFLQHVGDEDGVTAESQASVMM